MKEKKIKFSKDIVHFDGLKIESQEDLDNNKHHKFIINEEGKLES